MGTLVEIPEWTLIIAVAAWILTNVMVWIATGKRAGTILAGAKRESQAQKDEVVVHFDSEFTRLRDEFKVPDIEGLEAHIQGIDEALGAKFLELDEAMQAIPARVAQAAGSMKGIEMKALYQDAVEGEEELEHYAAEVMDPAEIAMARVEAIEPSAEWGEKHPLGRMLIEGGKELFRAKMEEAKGVVTMKRVTEGGKPKGFR